LLLAALFVWTTVTPFAQNAPAATAAPAPQAAKKALTIDDYPKWKSISGQEISGDGKWVAYVLQATNVPTTDTKPVLHIQNLDTGKEETVTDATGNAFSSDSKWIAYSVEPASAGRGGRGNRGGGPSTGSGQGPATTPETQTPAAAPAANPRRVELRNLSTGEIKSWQDIQSFTFSPTATHLLLRRRAPQPAGGPSAGSGQAPATPAAGGATPAPAGPRGVDVTVHNLVTGKDQLLGSVADSGFNKAGEMLAYTVDAATKDSNGFFVMDLKTSRIYPLDNDAKVYNRLTWNDAGTAVAVLKGLDVDKMREKNNVLLVYSDVKAQLVDANAPAAVVLDPSKTAGLPKDWVISERTNLDWSDDGKRVFFGMKPQVPAPVAAARRNADEVADVDIWNTNDERIQSQQMIRADQDRNFTFREAFDASAKRFVLLADETLREVDISPDGKWAIGRDTRGYISDYKPAAADIYLVNTSTGDRSLIAKNHLIGAGTPGFSADSKTYLFWRDNKFQAYSLETGLTRTLDAGAPKPAARKGEAAAPGGTNFVNMEYDHPGPKPSYGVAGYTADGKYVIVNQRYDLWLLPLDGSPAKNLTNGVGAKNEIRFRYVRTEPAEPGAAPVFGGRGGGGGGRQPIDLAKPVTLSAYGEYTKKAGFYELNNGALKEIVYEDASFSTPLRAQKADTYLFTRQTFTEFPDLRVSGPDFKTSKKITNANPQQAEFNWGRRILFDFKDRFGHRLQGILAIPDDYKPGQKRAMIVTFYEENASNLHRYQAPSYVTGMGAVPMQAVSEGYLTMMPDVHYHTGSSHSDQLDAVEAATRKVIEMGYADPKHIGLNGHSYGGEGASFIATRSKMFAAVGTGAGVTDLYTDFSQSWGWSYQVSGGSGANGNDYYLYGQGRWGFSPWDKPEVYHFESALTHVPETVAPILIMHGTADPTVSFAENMNFYNALRYNGKIATMLAYPGEGHGLRGLANRKDLTVRYFQFFDHYLRDGKAPEWMSKGVSYINKTDYEGNKIIK
jgi:dipeptidyl aminopeptidase/acylaminoacyl peptidase